MEHCLLECVDCEAWVKHELRPQDGIGVVFLSVCTKCKLSSTLVKEGRLT